MLESSRSPTRPPSLSVAKAEGAFLALAAGDALGPKEANENPVEPPPSPRSILADLERKGETRVVLGEFKQAQATELPSPKSLSASISVRAWRLLTAEDQTIYVTKARKSPTTPPVARATGKRKLATHVPPDARTTGTRTPDKAINLGADSPNPLYAEFCRQLRSRLTKGEVRRTNLTRSLDLVPSQINKWREQAEREGWLQRTCKNPAKYALSKGQRSLL